jgi:hypothetical protein
VLLAGGEHVLTCAHVLGDPGAAVLVECIGVRHAIAVRASVVPGGYVPLLADQRGDVALLKLDQPAAAAGTTLRRVALGWLRRVHACGFPDGLDVGIYTHATLAGHGYVGPGGEWLQLNPLSSNEQPVRPGFSGAGVVDENTGEVIGIVVGIYGVAGGKLAWMIPTETVVSYLAGIQKWVTGDPALGQGFNARTDGVVVEAGVSRDIANWLNRWDTGDCLMILVGSEIPELYRAVSLSNPEGRVAPASPAPAGTVPPIGSVDLAMNVSGMIGEQIAERILNRAGIPRDAAVRPGDVVRSGIPPMTLVLDGIDRTAEPIALLNGLLGPMAQSGHRLLLGFRDESSPSLAVVRSWEISSVGHRLERLAERIDALATAEEWLMSLSARVTPVAPLHFRAADLGLALAELRKIAQSEPAEAGPLLDRCERRTARAERRVRENTEQLEGAPYGPDELYGLLTAYQAKANDHGLVEDPGLAAAYDRAYELLWRSPVDVSQARPAVRTYLAAVRRAIANG